MTKEASIVSAGRDRLRPILMTAVTTIIGLLPLAVGGAHVSGLMYFPMARTVMGGLVSSVILTLVVLPYLSLGVERIAEWCSELWRRSQPGRRTPPPEAVPASTP
jgi:HAE1 family hydrophobic/amphiphilic exporter-1